MVYDYSPPTSFTDSRSDYWFFFHRAFFVGGGLGFFIDSDLSMETHVKRTVSCCFSMLRHLRNIRRQVPTAVFQSLVIALVVNRMDYCNSVLAGVPANMIRRLQSVQSAAAWLIFGIHHSEHITDALARLHSGSVFQSASCSKSWYLATEQCDRVRSPASLMCHLDRDSDHLTLTK